MNFMGMSISFNHIPLVAALQQAIFTVLKIAVFIVFFALCSVVFFGCFGTISYLLHLCMGLPVPSFHDWMFVIPNLPPLPGLN